MTKDPIDLPFAELDARLRAGGFSQRGFLGPGERLDDVIARDNARLARLGVTHEDVADRLESVIAVGERQRERWVRAEADLRVHVIVYRGYQLCPWTTEPDDGQCTAAGGVRFASIDWRIRNDRTRAELRGPGLIVHLIRAHRFFEGPASPYRVDPDALCALLGLGSGTARD